MTGPYDGVDLGGPLVDRPLEQRVVGAAIDGQGWEQRVLDRGLRVRHLAGPAMQAALRAVEALAERGEQVDRLLVRGELHRHGMSVEDAARLTTALPAGFEQSPSQLDAYVEQLLDLARRRQESRAGWLLRQAAETGSADQRAEALQLLEDAGRGAARARTHFTASDLAGLVGDYLNEAPADREETLSVPWRTIDQALNGGLRRGTLTTVVGHSSHGKSLVVDGMLDEAVRLGRRCGVYLSENTPFERVLRLVAALSGVGQTKLLRRALARRDMDAVVAALGRLSDMPLTLVNAGDMTVADVCLDVRRSRWDMAVVDHLHDFPYRDERELANHVVALRATATASTSEHAGTVMVVCGQLNQAAQGEAEYPKPPTRRGVKGTGAFYTASDVMLSTYLRDDGRGDPGLEGELRLLKNRNGGFARCDVSLRVARMRLEEDGAMAAAA